MHEETAKDKLLKIAKLISSKPQSEDKDTLDQIAAICSEHAPEARSCVLVEFPAVQDANRFMEELEHRLCAEPPLKDYICVYDRQQNVMRCGGKVDLQ